MIVDQVLRLLAALVDLALYVFRRRERREREDNSSEARIEDFQSAVSGGDEAKMQNIFRRWRLRRQLRDRDRRRRLPGDQNENDRRAG